MPPKSRNSQMDRLPTQKALKLALSELKEKNDGALLSARALKFHDHGRKGATVRQIWRVPLKYDQCGDGDCVDVGSQPKDMSLSLTSPELAFALVAVDTGVVLLRGTKALSQVNLGFPVTACALSPDDIAVVGGQDGKLHIYSINGDSLKEEAVLEKHRGAITVIRYSPDVSLFALADVNREAVLWNRISGEVLIIVISFNRYLTNL